MKRHIASAAVFLNFFYQNHTMGDRTNVNEPDGNALHGGYSNLLYRNLSPVSRFPHITTLDASCNEIRSLAPLEELSSLVELDLTNNLISDLRPLQGLSSLTELDLTSNRISDLQPLAQCSLLVKLNLTRNRFLDVSPLARISTLKHLTIDCNRTLTLAPLKSMTLVSLSAVANRNLASWGLNEFLESSPVMHLCLEDVRIRGDSSFERLRHLQSLDLSSNGLQRVPRLPHQITSLCINDNPIVRIRFLPRALEMLTMRHMNKLVDVSFLNQLPQLKHLDMAGCSRVRRVVVPSTVAYLDVTLMDAEGDWDHVSQVHTDYNLDDYF